MLKNFRKNSTPAPFVIVGLGNPGPEYKNNRHNVGFMVLDQIAEQLGERFARVKFESLIAQARHGDERLVLAKPLAQLPTELTTPPVINMYFTSIGTAPRNFYHLKKNGEGRLEGPFPEELTAIRVCPAF